VAVEIRRAGTDDVAVVADVRLAFLAEEHGDVMVGADDGFADQVRGFVERATHEGRWWSWLAEDGARVVGGLSMLVQEVPPHPRDPRSLDGFVFNVWVAPRHRRAGVGRRLVDACLDVARTDGLRRVALVATDAGRHLYESVGFTPDADLLRVRVPPT